MNEQSIFAEALGRTDSQERAAFLDQVCQNDPALRQRIERLLALHAQAGDFLESPPTAPVQTVDAPVTELPGTIIGPYKLLEEIGEGGMGTVWMAEQKEPIQRRVAVKVVKAGMDSKQVLVRFEVERQALALMDHPNIAKVLDAGATPTGRPFFVMELVKGTPITKYCNSKCLGVRERLELFADVCRAVQHAHQKGIIHRDIKPSNVLVAPYDGKPVVKVIDFGVAKATGQKLTEATLFTGFGAVVGTPEYMSPEQAEINNADIDTRSDIYALGVLLYELLTGTTPLTHKRVKEAALLEILRVIREEEPPRPSTRLSSTEELPSIAAERGVEPAKLSKLVRGELDWIVMKALEKDRNRRYETANGFALDIQRYLADEPVQACPPSAGYRFRKFLRRNWGRVVAACMLSLAILGIIGGVAWAAWDRQAREYELAQEKQEQAATLSAQVRTILSEVERLEKEQKWPEALAAALRAEAVLHTSDEPIEESESVRVALQELGFVTKLENAKLLWDADQYLFDFDAMDRAYLEAFAAMGVNVRKTPLKEASQRLRSYQRIIPAIVFALDDWAAISRSRNHPGARQLTELAQAIDDDPFRHQIRQAILDDQYKKLEEMANSSNLLAHPAASLWLLGVAQRDANQRVKVLQVAQLQHPGDFWINFSLGLNCVHSRPERLHEAVEFLQTALGIRPDSKIRANLGHTLALLGRHDEAVAVLQKGIELHPQYTLTYWALAFAYRCKNKHEEAIEMCRKVLEREPGWAIAYGHLGESLRDLDRLDEAVAALNKAVEMEPGLFWAWAALGSTLKKQGNLPAAEIAFRKAVELDPKHIVWRNLLAWTVADQDRKEEAVELFQAAVAVDPANAQAHWGLGVALKKVDQKAKAIASFRKAIKLDPNFVNAHFSLGLTLGGTAQLDEAIACYRTVIKLDPTHKGAHNYLGNVLVKKGQLEEAIASYRKAIELDPKHAGFLFNLGLALAKQNQLDEAITNYRKAIELDPKEAKFHHNLALALGKQKKFDEAITSYRKTIELEPKDAYAHLNLGDALRAKGQQDEAIASYRKAIELDPKLVHAHFNLGLALGGKGELDEIIACYRKVIELDPKHVDAHNNLGVALWKKGQVDEAIGCYRKAADLNPKYVLAHKNLARALKAKGQLFDAITSYRKVIELDPKHESAYFDLAYVLQATNQLDEAVTLYRKAIELNPTSVLAYNNLGVALLNLKKVDESIASFRKAAELDPKYALVHSNLGEAWIRKGKFDQAIAAFEQAICAQPDNDAACNKLAWLLATCPEVKLRDAEQAVGHAHKAVELKPENASYWNTLGAAQYRTGKWKTAAASLEKSIELQKGGDAKNWFFLSMTHWQLGEKEKALRIYNQAVQWMDTNRPQDTELFRFRDEAAVLLGVNQETKK